uniref:THAP domain-containing protein 1 n=1 Tax=Oryzias melastigma TaxID=30732 RepID=A0A3B3BDF2_ORYME
MVNRSVVFGCSNVPKKGVSLHEFPVKMKEWKAWKRFVCRTRNGWNGPTNNSTICSCHFTAESFVNKMQVDMGLAKNLFLNKDAIPCVYPEGTCHSQAAGGLATPTPQPSSAMRKRQVLQVGL